MKINILTIAGSLGAIGVALGALGAHALKPLLNEPSMQTYQTGVHYHLIHSVVLLVLGFQQGKSAMIDRAGQLFTLGILLFSGSLYFLALRPLIGLEQVKWPGAITPFGGISFIAGWILVCLSNINKVNKF